MALNKDILGQARYDAELSFFDKPYQQIIDDYGSLANARLAFLKVDSEIIINHFKANIQLTIPGAGMVAGSNPVTGSSITGTIL